MYIILENNAEHVALTLSLSKSRHNEHRCNYGDKSLVFCKIEWRQASTVSATPTLQRGLISRIRNRRLCGSCDIVSL